MALGVAIDEQINTTLPTADSIVTKFHCDQLLCFCTVQLLISLMSFTPPNKTIKTSKNGTFSKPVADAISFYTTWVEKIEWHCPCLDSEEKRTERHKIKWERVSLISKPAGVRTAPNVRTLPRVVTPAKFDTHPRIP